MRGGRRARAHRRGRALTALLIQRCEGCDVRLFPDRLRCPACGGYTFTRVPAGEGVVAEETTLRRHQDETQVRLGSVQLARGPVVIARLGNGTTAGATVQLSVDERGAIRADLAEGVN